MEYLVSAFRSRSETLKLKEILKNNGIPSEIVNTPKEANVGCGLSVKFPAGYLIVVKRAISNYRFKSFAGFFLVKEIGGKRITKSI